MKTFNPITISCFKAYDVRGELDVNLDSVIVYRIGRAFTQYLNYGQKNHGQKLCHRGWCRHSLIQ